MVKDIKKINVYFKIYGKDNLKNTPKIYGKKN